MADAIAMQHLGNRLHYENDALCVPGESRRNDLVVLPGFFYRVEALADCFLS